jgi:tetratricopeptide (TPR) repeat protein
MMTNHLTDFPALIASFRRLVSGQSSDTDRAALQALLDAPMQQPPSLEDQVVLALRLVGRALQATRPLALQPLVEDMRSLAHAAETGAPALAGSLWAALGEYLQVAADLAGAEQAIARAERMDAAYYGDQHPSAARNASLLAMLQREMGRPHAAQPLLERALALDEDRAAEDPEALARDLYGIGLNQQDLGDLERAREVLERAAALALETGGPHSVTWATIPRRAPRSKKPYPSMKHYLGRAILLPPGMHRTWAWCSIPPVILGGREHSLTVRWQPTGKRSEIPTRLLGATWPTWRRRCAAWATCRQRGPRRNRR